MDLFEKLANQLTNKGRTIVLPEGTDERILQAAERLHKENIVSPILVGSAVELAEAAEQAGVNLKGIQQIDPENVSYLEELVEQFVEKRKGKLTVEQAREQVKSPNYFGTMLVLSGRADGLVSGAVHSTADTVRPALQLIKTKPGITRTSGAFIMLKEEEKLVFADCAITVNPTAQELAEIAIASAQTAEAFGIEPRIAMLSFSSKGSASTEETTKVVEATAYVQEKAPQLIIDGELQFDAAYVPTVAAKKAPQSVLKGQATVFVFPTLEAGNIGYKLVERLAGYEAIGPILQGLNAPVNDLSRGCSAEDVYKLSLITAAQSLGE